MECALAGELTHHPPPVRRILSTTNAIENVHRQLRKIITTRRHFPTDEAALKLLYLALRHMQTRWADGPPVDRRPPALRGLVW